MAKKSAKQQDGGLLAASSWADQMASDQEDPDRDISSDPPQNNLRFLKLNQRPPSIPLVQALFLMVFKK